MNKIEEANIPPETLKWLENHIAAARWQTAKAANYPPELMHSYTMVHFDEKSRAATAALSNAIDKYGFDDDFFGQPQRYLVVGDYKYWYYLNKDGSVTLINREEKNMFVKRAELAAQKKADKEEAKRLEDLKTPRMF